MKKTTLILIVVAVVFLIALSIFYTMGYENILGSSPKNSITRSFSSSVVNRGDVFSVKYTINLNEGQKFYLLEDTYPVGFEVLSCGDFSRFMSNGKIKLLELDTTFKNKVIECKIKATSSGIKTFSGNYGLQGMTGLVSINGEDSITVK